MFKGVSLKLLLGMTALTFTVVPGVIASEPEDTVAGEVIVQIVSGSNRSEIAREVDAEITDSIPDQNIYLLRIPAQTPIADAVSKLEKKRGVLIVQPNTYIGLPEINQISQSFPDQTRPIYLQGIEPALYYTQPGSYDIGLDSAQLISTGSNVVVAVIDNGIDADHPAFVGAIAPGGHDFVDDDSDPSEAGGPMSGHGTFVAGLIRLTAPDCSILPFRAFDSTGLGTAFSITEAIYASMTAGAKVINMSFSMYTMSPMIKAAVREARQAGIVMVASTGNDHVSDSTYPAAWPEVIAVSAIDESEQSAWFSNYGDYIDICAPGVNLYSALTGEYQWGTWSGTSFSAALVSGACALDLSYRPSLTPQQVSENLIRSARTQLDWGTVTATDAIYYGSGCLDAFQALITLACGDVDNNGSIDVADLVSLTEYVTSQGPPPVVSLRVGDVNCDGSVDMADVEMMRGFIAHGKGLPKPCYSR